MMAMLAAVLPPSRQGSRVICHTVTLLCAIVDRSALASCVAADTEGHYAGM
jgi:hypothetical protein